MLDLFDLAIAKAINGDSGGGGGDITLETLNVSQNGTTNAPSGTAFNKVVASVPNTYAAGDEGKVVSGGALVSRTAHAQVTQNGTIDTTLNNSVVVTVPVPTLESKSISANGTYTPDSGKAWNEVAVNVPSVFETGTVSFHTGEVLKTLTIPISAEAEALDNYVIAVRPIKTWALVDGVWVERDTMDFTGINGFKSGSWTPVLAYLIGGKAKVFNNAVCRYFVSRGIYSNGAAGNLNGSAAAFDLVDGNLVTSPSNALNGSCVCVADGGLTFEYQIWGWS